MAGAESIRALNQPRPCWAFRKAAPYWTCKAIGAPRGLPKYCLTRDEMEANRIEDDPTAASDSFEARLKFTEEHSAIRLACR